jgi:hypothetical protein
MPAPGYPSLLEQIEQGRCRPGLAETSLARNEQLLQKMEVQNRLEGHAGELAERSPLAAALRPARRACAF